MNSASVVESNARSRDGSIATSSNEIGSAVCGLSTRISLTCSTTCAFVSTRPGAMTTPEPPNFSGLSRFHGVSGDRVSCVTEIFTTLLRSNASPFSGGFDASTWLAGAVCVGAVCAARLRVQARMVSVSKVERILTVEPLSPPRATRAAVATLSRGSRILSQFQAPSSTDAFAHG